MNTNYLDCYYSVYPGGKRSIQFTILNMLGFSGIDKSEVQSANILSIITQQINIDTVNLH